MLRQFLREILSKLGKTPGKSPAPSTIETQTSPSSPTDTGLDELVAHAATRVAEAPAGGTMRLADRFAPAFSSSAVPKRSINIFVFHADLPQGVGIQYRDISISSQRYDYVAVLRHFLQRVRRFQPHASIVLVTSPGSAYRQYAADDVAVIELEVDFGTPMYSRALAMYAYTISDAFHSDTVFLDSDAFLNAPLGTVFELEFDVGLTYRMEPGLMPVNEGVIFARAARKTEVSSFFGRIIGTYDRLAADSRVLSYYGDIRKWRGGQLSLNAVAHTLAPFSPYSRDRIGETVVRFFPGDTFNYSWDYAEDPNRTSFDGRTIIHLKGARKKAIDILDRAVRPPSLSDRMYSMDVTPPVDYEPDETLDYASATLTEVADHFKTDKGSIKHRYTDIYERYFSGWRGKPVEVLEIGIACGSSLKAWACWFGPQSRITGVDIRPDCAALCDRYDIIDILIADATTWISERDYDVILDDGSHVSLDVVMTFRNLWPRVRRGGYYVVEDLRCTHDAVYTQNFTFHKDPDAFKREHFIGWLDQELRRLDAQTGEIEYMHFYPQLLVIKKK